VKDRGIRGGPGIPYVPDATPEASIDPLLTDYIRRELEKIQDYTRDSGDRLTAAELSVGRRNILINGGFDVWQRGTSFFATAGTSEYTADRWRADWSGASGSASRGRFLAGSHEPRKWCIKFDITTSSDYTTLLQAVENGVRYQGKTLTASCYARQAGNRTLYSKCWFYNTSKGESSDNSNLVNITELLGGSTDYKQISWQLEIPHFPSHWNLDDIVYLIFNLCDTYDDTSTDPWTFTVFDVQLEEGERATPFEILSIGETLALCQRYYTVITGETGLLPESASSTLTVRRLTMTFPTMMRVTPSCSVSGVTNGSITNLTQSPTSIRFYGSASAANQYLYCTHIVADAEI